MKIRQSISDRRIERNGFILDLCLVITYKYTTANRTVEATRENKMIFRGTNRIISCTAVFFFRPIFVLRIIYPVD